MDSKEEYERTPILQNRNEVDAWMRKFNDYCTGKKVWKILNGYEDVPAPLTLDELQQIPAAARYTARSDREKKIEVFEAKSDEAFSILCKAVEKDNLIYGCAALDTLRQTSPRDPAAAFQLVMAMLNPAHVDAQMTVDALIQNLRINSGESAPALIQRLAGYVQRLPLHARPNDETQMKYIKRAMKAVPAMWERFQSKIEAMMDREPPLSYTEFCDGLMRKHEQLEAESTQEAALNTETSQSGNHAANEEEYAYFTHGKGAKGGRGARGRGRGKGRHMGRGHVDARIGAMYYAQGEKGDDLLGHKRPFYRGGGRHDGGRGYDFDRNYGKGGRGGRGKGGGKGEYHYKPKFDGNCNRCGNYGHKEADCYAKKMKY